MQNRTVYTGSRSVELHPTEEGIARNPWQSYRYAKDILKGPFPAGERAMAKNGFYAFEYAKTIKRRFIEGEKAIANSKFAKQYIKRFDKTGELGLKAILDELIVAPRPRRTTSNYRQMYERINRYSDLTEFIEPTGTYQLKPKNIVKDWQKNGF